MAKTAVAKKHKAKTNPNPKATKKISKKGLVKAVSTLDETSAKGELKRVAAGHRNWISKSSTKFLPEKNRYHLYISWACPWANRCAQVRHMKGLQSAIGLTVVHPTWKKTRPMQDEHAGWTFGDKNSIVPNLNGFGQNQFKDIEKEPFYKAKSIRDLYERANDTHGKYSVPVLWDTKLETIVSNESSEIIQMLNSEFNAFATKPDLDLAPKSLRKKMDAVDGWIYEHINNGVYKCGFALSQEAFDAAINGYTAHMEKLDRHLAKRKYLTGDTYTLSDVRLFQTLIRNDEVYTVYFKCDTSTVREYSNIFRYCVDVWQVPGVKETTKMDHIKTHYFTSHPKLNYFGIVPKGPNFIGQLEAAAKGRESR